MKPHLPRLFFASALICLSIPVLAATDSTDATPTNSMRGPTKCHTLMTEQECGKFKATLAKLNPGPAREHYLAEHFATMQERESACSCNQKVMDTTFYPQRRQAMLRF